MFRLACTICICLISLPVVCETAAKYEVATIIDVKPHQVTSSSSSTDAASYDVYVRVADTIYLVLYTDTLGTSTVKYAAGRELLVHVGKKTIAYNDILGRSQEVPIMSQKPATNAKLSK
jgi:hypothetical protein